MWSKQFKNFFVKMKKYNFDEPIQREGTSCAKYDGLNHYFGVQDAQPLWVADMDFAAPKFVQKALKKKLKQQVYGYEIISKEFFEAVIFWQKRFSLQLQKEQILFTAGVVPSLSAAIRAFSEVGDEVIVQPPVYFPFFSVIKHHERKILENPLKQNDGYYSIDFEQLEQIITPKTKLFLLCSPHNPVGRVWSQEELTQLKDICQKHNILVISDEIHSDIVFSKFTSYASIEPHSLILNAPSKSFNVAGFNSSYAFSFDEKILKRFQLEVTKSHLSSLNSFSNTLIESCYSKQGQKWLEKLLIYLQNNIKFTQDFLGKNLPKVKVTKSEATYLLWLDFKDTNLTHEKIKERLLYGAKVALNDGLSFGKNGEYHFRLNIALPKKELEKALKKIQKEFGMRCCQ